MSLFNHCDHRWEEVKRTYNPGLLKTMTKFKGAYEDHDIHGFTNIELRCAHCGDLKHRTVVGEAQPPERGGANNPEDVA